jgi:hypothetical protein
VGTGVREFGQRGEVARAQVEGEQVQAVGRCGVGQGQGERGQRA